MKKLSGNPKLGLKLEVSNMVLAKVYLKGAINSQKVALNARNIKKAILENWAGKRFKDNSEIISIEEKEILENKITPKLAKVISLFSRRWTSRKVKGVMPVTPCGIGPCK